MDVDEVAAHLGCAMAHISEVQIEIRHAAKVWGALGPVYLIDATISLLEMQEKLGDLRDDLLEPGRNKGRRALADAHKLLRECKEGREALGVKVVNLGMYVYITGVTGEQVSEEPSCLRAHHKWVRESTRGCDSSWQDARGKDIYSGATESIVDMCNHCKTRRWVVRPTPDSRATRKDNG